MNFGDKLLIFGSFFIKFYFLFIFWVAFTMPEWVRSGLVDRT